MWRRRWRKRPLCGWSCWPGLGWWERTSRTAVCASLHEDCCRSCSAPGGLPPPKALGTSAGPGDREEKPTSFSWSWTAVFHCWVKCNPHSYPRLYRQRHLWNVKQVWRRHCSRYSHVSYCETDTTFQHTDSGEAGPAAQSAVINEDNKNMSGTVSGY